MKNLRKNMLITLNIPTVKKERKLITILKLASLC